MSCLPSFCQWYWTVSNSDFFSVIVWSLLRKDSFLILSYLPLIWPFSHFSNNCQRDRMLRDNRADTGAHIAVKSKCLINQNSLDLTILLRSVADWQITKASNKTRWYKKVLGGGAYSWPTLLALLWNFNGYLFGSHCFNQSCPNAQMCASEIALVDCTFSKALLFRTVF